MNNFYSKLCMTVYVCVCEYGEVKIKFLNWNICEIIEVIKNTTFYGIGNIILQAPPNVCINFFSYMLIYAK